MSITCLFAIKMPCINPREKTNEQLSNNCNYFSCQGRDLVSRRRRSDIYIYLSRAGDFAPRLTLRTKMMSRWAINLAAFILSKLTFKNSKPN